jgi:hypothetical protein
MTKLDVNKMLEDIYEYCSSESPIQNFYNKDAIINHIYDDVKNMCEMMMAIHDNIDEISKIINSNKSDNQIRKKLNKIHSFKDLIEIINHIESFTANFNVYPVDLDMILDFVNSQLEVYPDQLNNIINLIINYY